MMMKAQFLQEYPSLILRGWHDGGKFSIKESFKNIVFCGMGGSGVAGFLLKNYIEYLKCKLPFSIVQDYSIPLCNWNDSLCIIASYSGDTDEVISCYKEAKRRGMVILSLTSGGRLQELCKMNNTYCIILPKGYQPRMTSPYQFMLLLKFFQNMKLIDDQEKNIEKVMKALEKDVYREIVAQLSEQLQDKLPLIYTSKLFSAAALRWKQALNENTKIHCFTNVLPEMDHNELLAFCNNKYPYHVIFLTDEEDSSEIQKRIRITKEMIKANGTTTSEIAVRGECHLARLFSALFMGDTLSYYLADYYDSNPLDVGDIEVFKKHMRS